jgi:hypothetical protein
MEMFSGSYDELESLAEEIASRYEDMDKYRFTARTIQRYELLFWEAMV